MYGLNEWWSIRGVKMFEYLFDILGGGGGGGIALGELEMHVIHPSLLSFWICSS